MAFSPTFDLRNHCSVISDSTLYVYSAQGFQALPLKKGGKWKKLSSGVAVDGAECVRAVPNGDSSKAALYIVGGIPTSDSPRYSGLQKFSFAEQRWETIEPMTTSATKNRVSHGATFLNSTNQILTYAGSNVPSQRETPSSATFLVSIVPPYAVEALSGPPAPPLLLPMLSSLNASHAVMVGGDPTNQGVFTFSSASGWADYGVKLPGGIQNQASTKCTVVTGDDGSKMLELYNLGVSPNVVKREPLAGAGGDPIRPRGLPSLPANDRQRRALTEGNWPEYDNSLAPAVTRTGFSIAEDPESGWAYISSDEPSVPLSIFDQRKATWIDPAAVFGAQNLRIQSSATASSTLQRPTDESTSAPTSAPAASSDSDDSQSQMLTVLGATLGSIFGVAALLVIVLLLLRWKRERTKRRKQSQGYFSEKDRLSFVDRGEEFMKDTGDFLPPDYSATPRVVERRRSSVNIIPGFGQSGHRRGLGTQGSDASTAGLIKKGPFGANESVELSRMSEHGSLSPFPKPSARVERPPPAALASDLNREGPERSRSSGWSRYFANNEATNLAQMEPARTYGSGNASRSSSATGSFFTDSRGLGSHSPKVRPLELDFTKFDGSGSLKGVTSGSPTLGHSRDDIQNAGVTVSNGMKAELSRGPSASSTSTVGKRGTDDAYQFSTAVPPPRWTATAEDDLAKRPPSSIYTESARGSTVPYGHSSSYYDSNPPSYHPKLGGAPGYHVLTPQEGRESTVTVFPRGVPSLPPPRDNHNPKDKNGAASDMSWLNLGQSAS